MGGSTQALREIDAIHGCSIAPPCDQELIDKYRVAWCEAEDSSSWNTRLTTLVRSMLGEGLSLDQAAQVVSRHPSALASYLTLDPSLAPAIVRADRLMRRGELSHRQIAAQCGLTPQHVARLAEANKQKSIATKRLEEGHGLKYSADERQRMIDLKAEGYTFSQISEMTGTPIGTVKATVRRAKQKGI